MKNNRLQKIFILFSSMGSISFVVLTTIAMILYPGGYYYFNFFSDLGFQTAHYFTPELQQPNPISSKIFLFTLILTGSSFMIFWISLVPFFKNKTVKIFNREGALVWGIISSVFLIAVAFFPTDLYGIFHVGLAWIALLFFAFAMASFSVLILDDGEFSNIYGILGLIFTVNTILFLFGALLPIHAIHQKTVFYSFIIWILLMNYQQFKKINESS